MTNCNSQYPFKTEMTVSSSFQDCLTEATITTDAISSSSDSSVTSASDSGSLATPMPSWVTIDLVEPHVGYKKVLVTGGAGFIGSHVAEFLLERGDDVVIVDEM